MRSGGERARPPGDAGWVERGIVALGLLGALAWLPYMVLYWQHHGWPVYPETYFVGLVVFPVAIFLAGRVLALGARVLRLWWQGRA
jgi:hypothetical protein